MKLMKQIAVLCIALLIVLIPVVVSAVKPFASYVFASADVSLNSNKSGIFNATTIYATSVSVTSCTLERKDGSKWVDVGSLTPPSHTSSNSYSFSAIANYSSSLINGNTYRITAVFSADGETVTRTSSQRTY